MSGGWSVEDIPKEPEPEAPPEATLEELRAAKLDEINAGYTLATSTLRHGYPNTERESWPVQIMESAAVIAGADVDTPWIDAAAGARGITRLDLAEKIRDMDVAYRQYHGAMTGKRQALAEQVAGADADGLAAIVWDAA